MTAPSALPGRVLRVGVTGARRLDPAQLPRLTEAVTQLLHRLATAAAACGAPPRRELLSALAEGADRLVADCALAAGFSLVCPLPFAPDEYEKDFATPESRAEFHRLLARAEGRVLALDGARGDDETPSYEAAGRLIVRNCDLLIGIWNGRPGKGTGGTITYAARFGPPVVWLHATDPTAPPRWIEAAHDLRHGAPARAVEPLLGVYLTRLLTPPATPEGGDHSVLHRLGHGIRHLAATVRHRLLNCPPPAPFEVFLRERPCPPGRVWRLHGWLMRTMAGGRKAPWTPPRRPADRLAALWFDHYLPADERAREFAARYRSSYVWAFALAALALAAAAVALGFPACHAIKAAASAAEFAALALILALVLADSLLGWQRRAIEYRLLAELCRKQQVLAPLAWVVPRAGAWATTAPEPRREPDAPPPDHAAWVPWLFSAWLREAPLPTGTLNAARVAAARDAALHDLIEDQITYHETRRAQFRRAGSSLVRLGEALFVAVLVLVAVKLWLLAGDTPSHGWLLVLGLAGAILPALSAAFVGIRAYAELEILTEQSDVMLKAMRPAQQRLQDLDPAAPLASQAVGGALAPVATLMLEDLEGWARLFRGKGLEA